MNYKAMVNVDWKSFLAKTDASSAAEAYNKIHRAATSKFPNQRFMIFNVSEVSEVEMYESIFDNLVGCMNRFKK